MDNDKAAVLAIKKDIKRIRRSGLSAEILGFLLILAAAGAIWLTDKQTTVIIIFSVAIVLGIYYSLSGSYIRSGWGRRVKFLLLFNGLLAIPLCVFVIPIYVCIQSINNYSRFKDLPYKIQDLFKRKQRPKFGVIWLILLIIVSIISVASFVMRLNNIHKQTKSNQTTVNSTPPVSTAFRYNFKITFPSQPDETDFTKQDAGHTITYTTYVSHSNDGSQDFNVYAYNWPAKFYNFDKLSEADKTKATNKALNDFVKSRNGTVVSSNQTTFQGHTSLEAEFTSPTLDKPVTGYIRIFYIGNYEYDVISLNAKQVDFNIFADTFQYVTNQ